MSETHLTALYREDPSACLLWDAHGFLEDAGRVGACRHAPDMRQQLLGEDRMQPHQLAHRIVVVVHANVPKRIFLAGHHIDCRGALFLSVSAFGHARSKRMDQPFHERRVRLLAEGLHCVLDHLRPFEPVALYAEIAMRLPAGPRLAALAGPNRGAAVAVDYAELPPIHTRIMLTQSLDHLIGPHAALQQPYAVDAEIRIQPRLCGDRACAGRGVRQKLADGRKRGDGGNAELARSRAAGDDGKG